MDSRPPPRALLLAEFYRQLYRQLPTSERTAAQPRSNHMSAPASSLSIGARVKQLFKKYGKVAHGVHVGVYSSFLAGCYIAVDQKVDVKGMLENVGLIKEPKEGEEPGWLSKSLSGGGSTIAMAILLNKAMFPIRTPITLGLTPYVARVLGRRAATKSAGGRAAR